MQIPRRQPLKVLHINRMIPSILTLLALSAGLNALRFALQERWEHAVLAIVAAGVFDALDGRIARMLKGTSKFGAELDSLSDFLCFGVAPAIMLYLWAWADSGRFGWFLVMLLCTCCALRLARFNADLGGEEPAWSQNFFIGVPAPAGAGTVLLPMVLWFHFESDVLRNPVLVGSFIIVGSLLLVSRVRTFSFKKIRLTPAVILPVMLGVALYVAVLVSSPWITLALTQIAYLGSLPFSIRLHRRFQRHEVAADAPPAP